MVEWIASLLAKLACWVQSQRFPNVSTHSLVYSRNQVGNVISERYKAEMVIELISLPECQHILINAILWESKRAFQCCLA